ncbi:MAG: hypothetical protein V7695_18870, partial [Sulfitobacter sp.]
GLSAPSNARLVDGAHQSTKPVTNAASAAERIPHNNPQRVFNVPVKLPPSTRPIPHARSNLDKRGG